jgi:hypothetical protein
VQRVRLATRALDIANATRMVGSRHFEVIKPRPRNPEKLNLGAICLF